VARGGLRDIQLDDVGDFEVTDHAMSLMGLSDAEKLAIYGIVAGVLHLGNAMFEEDPVSKGQFLSVTLASFTFLRTNVYGEWGV